MGSLEFGFRQQNVIPKNVFFLLLDVVFCMTSHLEPNTKKCAIQKSIYALLEREQPLNPVLFHRVTLTLKQFEFKTLKTPCLLIRK